MNDEISIFDNPFLLNKAQIDARKDQANNLAEEFNLVPKHLFAVISKKNKAPRMIIFQKQLYPDRENRLRLINGVIKAGWKEMFLWAMGTLELRAVVKKNSYQVHFTMDEEESLSPELIKVFIPFIQDLNKKMSPFLGSNLDLDFHFSKLEEIYQGYRIKAVK